MQPLPESRYWIEAPSTSITDDPDAAVLVLRLALAVNALRSQQRYGLSIGDAPQPAAARRDRVLSFVIAAAFITEALNILRGTGRGEYRVPGQDPAVRALAQRGHVPPEVLTMIGQLLSGRHAASPILQRIRNQLTFHWDPGVVRESLRGFETDEPLIWAEGETTTVGESIYRLAADVLANALILERADVPDGQEDEAGSVALRVAVDAVWVATNAVSQYFEHAIAGYVDRYAVARERQPEVFPDKETT